MITGVPADVSRARSLSRGRTFRTLFRTSPDITGHSGHLSGHDRTAFPDTCWTPDRTLPDIFRTLPVTFRTVPCVRMSSFKTGHLDMIGHWSFPDTTGHTWSISGHRIRGRSAHKKNRTFHFSIFCLLDIYILRTTHLDKDPLHTPLGYLQHPYSATHSQSVPPGTRLDDPTL